MAKSNLQLVIANNDMLEDALKRDSGGQSSKDVGWRRTNMVREDDSSRSTRVSLDRSHSTADYTSLSSSTDMSPPNSAATPPPSSENRFFKFKFSSVGSSSSSTTRPGGTPAAQQGHHHLNSPSMPSLSSLRSKEVEELTTELEKERAARKGIAEEKATLESELESLSQALFEEANIMVATERKMRAETEEELKELKQEKEALRSALRLIGGGENTPLRGRPGSDLSTVEEKHIADMIASFSPPASRSSSRMAIKSRPTSLDLYSTLPPLPPSPSPSQRSSSPSSFDETSHDHHDYHPPPIDIDVSPTVLSPEEESQPTPRFRRSISETQDDMFLEASPWS